MGSFSNWHLVVVLFIVGLPVVGIATAGHVKQLQRGAYVLRVVGLVIVSFILGITIPELLAPLFADPEDVDNVAYLGSAFAVLLLFIVAEFLCARWSAHGDVPVDVEKLR